MSSIVLNEKLLLFSQKYIARVAPLSNEDPQDIKIAYRNVVCEFAEQLLLFDTIIVKLETNNYPVSIIINELGLEQAIECIQNGTIRFLLWTPAMFFGSKVDNNPEFKGHNTYPFNPGYYSSPIHSDPKEAINSSFDNVGYNYDRNKRRDFVRKASSTTILFKDNGPAKSINFIVDSYKSNALASLGIPYESDLYDLEDLERRKILNLASEISDITFLANNRVQSYNQYTCITLLHESLNQINSAVKSHTVAEEVYKIEDLPSFNEMFNHNKFDFYTILKLRKHRESQEFRKWIGKVTSNKESGAINKEYLDFVTKKYGFFETTAGKLTKDVALVTTSGFIGNEFGVPAGLLSYPLLAKSADFGLNFFSSLIFDKMVEGWNPRLFAENIRKVVKE